MKFLIIPIVFLAVTKLCQGGPLRLQKRAAFYIANETACVVDNTVYSSGDPIPTDDPCEACKCRPPGFACVLKECQVKPGCRAVRRAGHCCPEYICGCEHNGRMYRDGDEIRDAKNPCYTCHCQGSSIACAFVDCLFRVDCTPEYVVGECCPRYPQCSSSSSNANSSYGAESTINPDIGPAVTTLPQSDTSLLDESKVEYVSSEAPLEEKVVPETTVDSDSASPYIPEAINEEILERNNAGTTVNEATTLSNPVTETIEVLAVANEEEESPDLLNTESEIKKDYVEESGEEVSHEVLTTEASPALPESTEAGLNVEIFADETTSKKEESYTTEGELTTEEEEEIEANTIEKTFRALKNFTSEDDAESEDKEQSESPEKDEKSELPEISESPENEEKSESPEEKSESPENGEKSESPENGEKSESPENEEKSETPEEESESSENEKSESREDKSELLENEEKSESLEEKSEKLGNEEKSELQEEKSESPKEEKSDSPENEKKSESPEEEKSESLEKSETAYIEKSEYPEKRELSDSDEVTSTSEVHDASSTPVNEPKTTDHTNSPASETTPQEPTTKNPESLYYVNDKITPSESSETVTVNEETSSQVNEVTPEATESKDAMTLPTSEVIYETTQSGHEKSETTLN